MVRVGIVKPKYSSTFRWIFSISITLLILVIFPLLMALDVMNSGIVFVVSGVMIILGLILIDKIADDIIILGEIEIREHSFVFNQSGRTITIPFKEIRMILLKPLLGSSGVVSTFKVYNCQIKTYSDLYSFQITREEIIDGKLIRRNLMNPSAFDLIKFLEKKNIQHRFGKRMY